MNFRKPSEGRWEDNYSLQYFPALLLTKAPMAPPEEIKEERRVLQLPVVCEEELKAPVKVGQAENSALVNSLLKPNPILKLETIVGFTGRTCPDIKFSKTEANTLYFASGNTVIQSSTTQFSDQFFFTGHKACITCLDICNNNKLMASCEEGNNPVLRLWDLASRTCVGKFNMSISDVRCISFSFSGSHLCMVGSDKLSRDEIIVIEIYDKKDDRMKGARIVARQISEFNILTIKFSPIDSDRLVSCGKENIRFWRVKNQHLPGGAVVLNHHARDTIFTVFDFDFGKGDQPQLAARDDIVKRVLVGSKHGYLYQVNYDTRQLESVFKIHDLSICSLAVSAGFCVTGSQDMYIRVWPLDFSEFFLEAQHESIIISLDISMDGLQVACGTSANSLSILDLTNQNYKTMLRSHSDTILCLRYQANLSLLVSLSKDGSIRIWGSDHEQIYEFNFSKEDECLCIDVHPKERIFVGGFQSGVYRVFSLDKVEVISEHKFHNQPIEDIKFSKTGNYLGIGDGKGFYSLVDVSKDHQFVKTFESNPTLM